MLKRRKAWACALAVLAVAMGSIVMPASGRADNHDASISVAGVMVADGLPPEVRLRKLHLVRPDLIPYPLDYEVIC